MGVRIPSSQQMGIGRLHIEPVSTREVLGRFMLRMSISELKESTIYLRDVGKLGKFLKVDG